MINPRDILFYLGGAALARYGTLTRRTTPASRSGEEAKEIWTRPATGLFRRRDGTYGGAAVNVGGIERLDLDSDGVYETPTMLPQMTRTNVVLHSRDLTNAAWTKTNVTAAKDQVGIDGLVNSASKITASAGNGTCLQAITLVSSARYQTAFVKRVTGSGVVNMTMDNGATWTVVTVTAAWTRVSIPTQTLADPTVGFRIVTSGDAIAVDCVQNENGTWATNPIVVTTLAVERGADVLSVPYYSPPQAMTIYAKFEERGTINVSSGTVVMLGSSGVILKFQATAGAYQIRHAGSGGATVTSTAAAAPVLEDTVELLGTLSSTGVVQLTQSINAAAAVTAAASATNTLGTVWTGSVIYPGQDNGNVYGNNPIVALIGVRGAPTLAECRELLPTFSATS